MERFEKLYRQLFENICEYAAKKGESTELATHFPIVGKKYSVPSKSSQKDEQIRFMLVGRCTNGWNSQKHVPFLSQNEEEYSQQAKKHIADNNLASKWREDAISGGYNINYSAFWRTARNIWAELSHQGEPAEEDWYEHIVWVNLFPVGPKEQGNASNELCDAQTDTAIELFKATIRYYRPTHILVESGMNWFSFSYRRQHHAFLENIDLSGSNRYVAGRCVFQETQSRIIIANRPETMPNEEYCNEIIHAFKTMAFLEEET